MSEIVLALAAFVVIVKDAAYLWGIGGFVRNAGRHINDMQDCERRSRARKLLGAIYRTPSVVTIAVVLLFLFAANSAVELQLTLAIATAVCSMLALITALLRRLVLGSRDWETSDVQLPGAFSEWAVSTEPGANNSVYFLVLVYLSIIGFAALYFSMAEASASSFAHFGPPSGITALYLSITTLATVGYGDIHAATESARVAVIMQISTGPLLLSWLLATLVTVRERRDSASPGVPPSE